VPNLIKSVTVGTVVDATPEVVWAVAGDPTRVGEWSHECVEVEWCPGSSTAVPGARFRGRNRLKRAGWTRENEVVTADAPRELAWRTVPTRRYPDSTLWKITLEPVDGGTRITQSYEILHINPIVGALFWLLIPRHRDRTAALQRDVCNLGEVARTGAPAAR
jgi:Polyketide cyclase / dehydrase and lipid transport